MFNRIYIHGDCHGNFDWLQNFCYANQTSVNDLMILAGDSGLLFFGKTKLREQLMKEIVANCPITILAVRGNHDNRPTNEDMELRWNDRLNGECYWEDDYPNILYAKDGGFFTTNGRTFCTIGGAYSVDKYYRLMNHWTWYADEELTDDEMNTIFNTLEWSGFDYIITHTAPLEYEPTWLFMSGIDQSKVSKRMETFLDKLSHNVAYKAWFFGHYHGFHMFEKDFPDKPCGYDNPCYTMLFNETILLEDNNTEYSFLTDKPIIDEGDKYWV